MSIEIKNMIKEELEKRKEKSLLLETTFQRLRQHFILSDISFIMISAYRNERTGKENKKLHKEMKNLVVSKGFPFADIGGGFKETTDKKEETEEADVSSEEAETEEEEKKKLIDVKERTLVITEHERGDKYKRQKEEGAGDLFDLGMELSKRYNQQAFIYGETALTKRNKEIKIIRAFDRNGNIIKEDWAGPWDDMISVTKDAVFWSKVRGKYFQLFEDDKPKKKTSKPNSWIDAMRKSRSGEEW